MKMLNDPDPELDLSGPYIAVGQDEADHWLVQESGGRMEGRFVSFQPAMAFAHAERHGFPGARVITVSRSLTPIVPFLPAAPYETALARAA